MSYIIKLGFSPCPNDTFIFDALVHNKIDTSGIDFICEADDIENLNKQAIDEELDMVKVSYHAYLHIAEKYQLLNAGSALGRNCGPLLVAKKEFKPNEITSLSVAIPGKYTTAALLLKFAFPEVSDLHIFRFDHIENRILKETVDAGVIIHENRFTYSDKGLIKLLDLGEYWEQQTGFPVPLGGIAVKRDMPEELKLRLQSILRSSIEFAWQNPQSAMDFIRAHASEIEDSVIRQHIDLYVNNFTLNLGEDGQSAVKKLFQYALESKIINRIPDRLFVD